MVALASYGKDNIFDQELDSLGEFTFWDRLNWMLVTRMKKNLYFKCKLFQQDSINRIVNSLKLENVQHHLVVGNTIQKKAISREFQYFQIEHDPNTKIKLGFW